MVSGQWVVVSGQWVVVSGQWSVGSGQWSVVSGQWVVVSGQWSKVTHLFSPPYSALPCDGFLHAVSVRVVEMTIYPGLRATRYTPG